MPEEVFIDSNGRLSSTSSASTKHKGDKSEVIDILRDMQAGHQQKRQRKSIGEIKRKSTEKEKKSTEVWSTCLRHDVKHKMRLEKKKRKHTKTGKNSARHMITS